MNLEKFFALRPAAFHITSARNLEQIRASRVLQSAAQIFETSGNAELIDRHRPESVLIEVGGATIHVRDQAPLHRNAIEFEKGWSFARYVALLNSLVFFWPGANAGPIARGRSHHERYKNGEQLVVLRVPMRELFALNGSQSILLTSVNSGSARSHPAVGKAPRGGGTHVPVPGFKLAAGKVVEVAIKHSARLPSGTMWSGSIQREPWSLL